MPSFIEEEILKAQGYHYIAGVDEVGRGALAGPVAEAAVILPHHIDEPWMKLVKDSKLLSPAQREYLFRHINEMAIAVGVGLAYHEVVDS